MGDDYDCDVPPPLSVDPFTCCKVSKPFDHINFPECFAPPPPPPPPPLPTSLFKKIYLSSTFSPPIPVSEDFHDDYTPSPTRSSIFKKKFKPAQYQTSTSRPIWPPYYHPDDDSSSSSKSDSSYSNDGQDYDKNHKFHYYHHHGDSDGSGGSGSSSSGRSSGYGHWPGKYQHWGYDNNQRQYYGNYHHSYGRHRRGAPNYAIQNARTSNVSIHNNKLIKIEQINN